MKLVVLTPEATLLEADQLEKVRVPLADGGSIGIQPNHHPLLAETVSGRVEYGKRKYTREISLQAGILRVEPDQVAIYTGGLLREKTEQVPEEKDTLAKTLQNLQDQLESEA